MTAGTQPRLWLRKRPGDKNSRSWKWTILHDGKQISTKLSAHDDPAGDRAALVLARYMVGMNEDRPNIDLVRPEDIDMEQVFDLLDATNIEKEIETVRERRRRILVAYHCRNLRRWWSGVKLTDVGEETCARYRNVRTQEFWTVQKKNLASPKARKVGLATIKAEMGTLKYAIRLYVDRHRLAFMPRVVIPKFAVRRIAWFRHAEVARLLWVCRGRVWDEEAGNLRRGRNGKPVWDSRLGGWKRDAKGRIVVDKNAAYARRPLARFIILAAWNGTRHEALMRARWRRSDHAGYVSDDLTVFHRRGDLEVDTTKSRTPVKTTRRLRAHLARWRKRDEAQGFTHVIHQPNGQPYATYFRNIKEICKEAGIPNWEDVVAHTFRHTCAHWLKSAGVPIWMAADYLGMTVQTLEAVYDHRDHHSQDAALELLDKRRRRHPLDRLD